MKIGANTNLFSFDEYDYRTDRIYKFGSNNYHIYPTNLVTEENKTEVVNFKCSFTERSLTDSFVIDCSVLPKPVLPPKDYYWSNKEDNLSFECYNAELYQNDTNDFTITCVAVVIPPKEWQENNTGQVTFDCNVPEYINTPIFSINCGSSIPSEYINIGISNGYFGYNSISSFLIDFSVSFEFGFESISSIKESEIWMIPVTRLQYGFESSHALQANRQLVGTGYQGQDSKFDIFVVSLLFQDQMVYGYESKSIVMISAYLSNNHHYGFESKATNFIYNPYHEFVTGTGSDSVKFQYGNASNTSIKYSDDPTFTKGDIPFNYGNSSNVTFKYANVYANLATNLAYGFNSITEDIRVPLGFKVTLGWGFRGITSQINRTNNFADIGIVQSYYGLELHNNSWKPRNFDLSMDRCCDFSTKDNEFKVIELDIQDGYEILYGYENGWNFSSKAVLQTQPRLAATSYYGSELKVYEKYATFEPRFEIGFSSISRQLQFDVNIDLGYGNFIIDQNNIKFELSAPLDIVDTGNSFIYGDSSEFNLSVIQNIVPRTYDFGYYSSFVLIVEEAIRGYGYYGFQSYGTLNTTVKLNPVFVFGQNSTAQFYEEPIYGYYGFTSSVSEIITRNDVEFLEEGELPNDYLFQTPNGDVDVDRPNGSNIEAYPFTHYINGRCY